MKLTKGRISKIKKAVKQSRKRGKGRRTAAGSRRTLRDKKSKHFLYESLKRKRRGGKRKRMQKGGKLSADQLAELPYGGNWQDAKKEGNRLAIRVIMDANKSGKVPTEGEEGWGDLQKAMAAAAGQDVTKQEQPAVAATAATAAATAATAAAAATADSPQIQPELDQSATATAPVQPKLDQSAAATAPNPLEGEVPVQQGATQQEPAQLATAPVAPDDQPDGTQPELGSVHDTQSEAADSRKLDADSLAHLKMLTDSLLSSDSLSSDDKKQLEDVVARVSPGGVVSSADQTALTHLSEVAGSAGWKPPVGEQDTINQQAIGEGVTASTQAIMNVVNEQRAQDPQSLAPALAGRAPELDAQLAGILSGSVSGGNRPWLVLGTQVDATAEGVVPARELETVHAGAGSEVGTVVELKEPTQEDVPAVQTSEQTFKLKSPVPPGQSYIFIVVGGRLLSANLPGLVNAMKHYNAYAGHTATAAENTGDFAGLAAHIVTMLGTDEAEQGLAKVGLRGLGRTSMTPKQRAARDAKAAAAEALEAHGVTSAVQGLADEDDADAATLAAEREGKEAAGGETTAVEGTEKHPVEATVAPVDAVPVGDSAEGGQPGKQCKLGIWIDPEKGIYKGEDNRPPSAPIFLLKEGAPSQPGCKDVKGKNDDEDDDEDEKSGIGGEAGGGVMTKPDDSTAIAHAVAVPMAAASAGTTTAAPVVATAVESPGASVSSVAHPLEDPADPSSQTPVAQQSQTSGGSRSRKHKRNKRRITKKRRKHRKKRAKRTRKRRRTRKKN